jgi:Fe2+-dicitrate sensor, membrane component
MNKDYRKYTSRELLDDDYFIQSMMHRTVETDSFWNSLIDDGILDDDQFQEARNFVMLMQRSNKISTAKEKNDLWVTIEIKNKEILKKDIREKKIYLWSFAASFLLLIGGLSFFLLNETESDKLDFDTIMGCVQKDSIATTKDIQLILSNKKTIQLEETSADIELDKEGGVHINSEKWADAAAEKEEKEEISYNQLIVPMGRHSRLVLPDGTKMHINAGSKVMFPNKFKKNEREIFVDGEAYLEVAHNPKVPFYVRTTSMDIKVRGTAFNVRAYQEDEEQSVVLVSGSVVVYTEDNHEAQLTPDQKLGYTTGKCTISRINSKDYVSWVHGYFIYNKEPLKNIMKQISRYYGVDVVCGSTTHTLTCSGKLDLKEELDIVMNDLANLLTVNITKNEKTYYITKE